MRKIHNNKVNRISRKEYQQLEGSAMRIISTQKNHGMENKKQEGPSTRRIINDEIK